MPSDRPRGAVQRRNDLPRPPAVFADVDLRPGRPFVAAIPVPTLNAGIDDGGRATLKGGAGSSLSAVGVRRRERRDPVEVGRQRAVGGGEAEDGTKKTYAVRVERPAGDL